MHALEALITVSTQRKKRCLLYVNCWLLSITPILLGDIVNLLVLTSCFLVSVLYACEGSLWKRLAVSTLYASTFFSFNALRDNYLKPYFFPKMYFVVTFPADIVSLLQIQLFTNTISLLFALLLYAGIKKFAPEKSYTLSDSLWKLLLLLTATPFGTILSIFLFFDGNTAISVYTLEHSSLYMCVFIITLLSFTSLLWCIRVLARQQALERQNSLMEINRKYYEAMEQQHFEIRRLKHDLANHLQVLSALPASQQAEYIQTLEHITAGMQPLSYCGDATVNAVLSVKKAAMDRYRIRSEISIKIPAELPFGKTDICALYANAIDNAIEACRKLKESDRTILIQSKTQKGLFCLKVQNPVSDFAITPAHSAVQTLKNLPPTSKPDKNNHGFGLKSIHEIVSKYDGELELQSVGGMFELFLYIPLPDRIF